MHNIDLFNEISENIDVGNPEQINLYQEILKETDIYEQFKKLGQLTLFLLTDAKNKTKKYESSLMEQQNSRLVTYLQYFIAMLQSLTKGSELFELFNACDNMHNAIKLIPNDFFVDQSERISDFLGDLNDVPADKINLLDNTVDLSKKLAEIRHLKSKTENSPYIDDVKNGFREVCSLFELSMLFNDLLVQYNDRNKLKIRKQNKLNEEREKNKEIEDLKSKLVQVEKLYNESREAYRKLQEDFATCKSQISTSKSLEDLIAKQQSVIIQLNQDIDTLNNRIKKYETNYKNIIEKLEKDRDKYYQRSLKCDELRTDNLQLEENLRNYQTEFNRANVELDKKIDELNALKKKLKKTQLILKKALKDIEQKKELNLELKQKILILEPKTLLKNAAMSFATALGTDIDESKDPQIEIFKLCEAARRIRINNSYNQSARDIKYADDLNYDSIEPKLDELDREILILQRTLNQASGLTKP